MADLDQGGVFRQNKLASLGPSVGAIWAPDSVPLSVGVAGTTVIAPATYTYVSVNVVGAVTIQLPTAISVAPGAIASPGNWADVPITVQDKGGNALAHPILIKPFGAETIDGLASVTINNNFGSYTFRPNRVSGGWTLS